MGNTSSDFTVSDMSCMHCVNAIKAALGQLNGVSDVAVDLGAKRVTVTHDPAVVDAAVLAQALDDAGYPVGQ